MGVERGWIGGEPAFNVLVHLHAAMLALVLSRGKLQPVLFKESTRLKEFSRRVCRGGSPFRSPATPAQTDQLPGCVFWRNMD